MALPTLFASLTSATGAQLDGDFAALGALTPIPCTVSGANVLVLTPSANTSTVTSYTNYCIFTCVASSSNTGAATAQVGTLPAVSIYRDTAAGPILLSGGEIAIGNLITLIYDSALNSGAGGFHLHSAPLASTLFGVSAYAYHANSTAGAQTLPAGNVTGGTVETQLNLIATQAGAVNVQLPTVAALVGAMSVPTVGQSYALWVINSGGGGYTITITTNTGWSLAGTMTIANATWRKFIVTLTSLTTAAIQSVGTGAYS